MKYPLFFFISYILFYLELLTKEVWLIAMFPMFFGEDGRSWLWAKAMEALHFCHLMLNMDKKK